jgi:hypothetical protein
MCSDCSSLLPVFCFIFMQSGYAVRLVVAGLVFLPFCALKGSFLARRICFFTPHVLWLCVTTSPGTCSAPVPCTLAFRIFCSTLACLRSCPLDFKHLFLRSRLYPIRSRPPFFLQHGFSFLHGVQTMRMSLLLSNRLFIVFLDSCNSLIQKSLSL